MGDYSDVCRGTNDDSRQPWTRTISFLGGAGWNPSHWQCLTDHALPILVHT
ncbi:hypothetical protein HMPREF9582_01433 [Cutibacterium acnes HL060PA1]|nr:hypothetical protein HMPREF9582_01433 [Cutibacterium acnes HL060PA1]EFT75668.1 hypothetical protein HMPREF9599_00702 [Cutibacterium acnes HL050PA2]